MFKKILWPTDFSKNSLSAIPYIRLIASRFNSKVYILHVIRDLSGSYLSLLEDPDLYRKVEGEREQYAIVSLQRIQKRMEGRGITCEAILRSGTPYDEILKVSEEIKPDLIVLSRRGLNPLESLLLGSISERVLHHTEVPTLLITQGRKRPQMRRILVPTDLSEISRKAYPFAFKIARTFDAEVFLLYVLELFAYDPKKARYFLREKDLKELGKKIQQRMGTHRGIKVRKEVIRRFEAGVGISEFAEEKRMSLIVMASHGRTGLGRFLLGSVTDKVVKTSSLPVLVIKARD